MGAPAGPPDPLSPPILMVGRGDCRAVSGNGQARPSRHCRRGSAAPGVARTARTGTGSRRRESLPGEYSDWRGPRPGPAERRAAMSHMTFLEASVGGLIQGVSELFPVSSLGHNVLIPALMGGSWATDLNVAKPESPYLAFIVGLHVATAIALLIYFWRDWVRIVGGFLSSIRDRRIETVDQKLAWMILLATIPVGLVGIGFEHTFRVLFGKPIRAAIFLIINGLILYAGE